MNVIAQYKPIGLAIYEDNVTAALTALENFPNDCSVYFLYHELSRLSEDKLISKSQFCNYFKGEEALIKLFAVFDRHLSLSVDISEFCIGASILLPGTIRSKLRFAFLAFGEVEVADNISKSNSIDYFVSRRSLWVIIRSYIVVIYALFSCSIDIALIDILAVNIVARIDSDLAHSHLQKTVRLSDVLDWCCDELRSDSWIGLLEFRSWVHKHCGGVGAGQAQMQQQLRQSGEFCLYQMLLELKASADAQRSGVDVSASYLLCLSELQLSSSSMKYCAYVLADIRENATYLATVFDEDKQTIIYLLFALMISVLAKGSKSNKLDFGFRLLSETGVQYSIEANVLSSARVCMLLTAYLRAMNIFSQVVLRNNSNSISSVLDTSSLPDSFVEAVQLASAIADNVMTYCDVVEIDERVGNRVSFEQFGHWYNSGGFELAPWLEMINLDKWTQLGQRSSSSNSSAWSSSSLLSVSSEDDRASRSSTEAAVADDNHLSIIEEEDEDEDEDEEEEEDDADEQERESDLNSGDVAFTIPLYSDIREPIALAIPRSDRFFLAINQFFALFEQSASSTTNSAVIAEDAVVEKFRRILDDSNDSSYVNSLNMNAIVRIFTSSRLLSRQLFEFLTDFRALFGRLLGLKDADIEDGCVDLTEFAVGCLFFTSGSKSSKLGCAYKLLDEDGDGFLTRRQLFLLFRSYLVALIALCSMTNIAIGTEEIRKTYSEYINSTSVWLTDSVFNSCRAKDSIEASRSSKLVHFAHIAEWYSEEGYQYASWVELLDHKKWRFVSASFSN